MQMHMRMRIGLRARAGARSGAPGVGAPNGRACNLERR